MTTRKYIKWDEEEHALVQERMIKLWRETTPSTPSFVSLNWDVMQTVLPKDRRRAFCSKKEIERFATILDKIGATLRIPGFPELDTVENSVVLLKKWKAAYDQMERSKEETRAVSKANHQIRRQQVREQVKAIAVAKPTPRHRILIAGIHHKDRTILTTAVQKKYPDIKLVWLEANEATADLEKRAQGQLCVACMHGTSPPIIDQMKRSALKFFRVNGITGVMEAVNSLKASHLK
jgi:hypothetical protein